MIGQFIRPEEMNRREQPPGRPVLCIQVENSYHKEQARYAWVISSTPSVLCANKTQIKTGALVALRSILVFFGVNCALANPRG